jgi:sec-independent protein translocase protein TatA
MIRGLEGWHFIIILVIVLLLWGAPKLPGLAKSLGQSMRIFRKEMKGLGEDKAADKAAANAEKSNGTEGDSTSAK